MELQYNTSKLQHQIYQDSRQPQPLSQLPLLHHYEKQKVTLLIIVSTAGVFVALEKEHKFDGRGRNC